MKKILYLILAALLLLLAGCQANDPSKTYTTDELIQKIEKDKKSISSEEDRENLIYVVKTVSQSTPVRTELASKLNCFIEDSDDYKMPFTETIDIYLTYDINTEDGYTDAAISYNSETDYIYHCDGKNWTIEIKE